MVCNFYRGIGIHGICSSTQKMEIMKNEIWPLPGTCSKPVLCGILMETAKINMAHEHENIFPLSGCGETDHRTSGAGGEGFVEKE